MMVRASARTWNKNCQVAVLEYTDLLFLDVPISGKTCGSCDVGTG